MIPDLNIPKDEWEKCEAIVRAHIPDFDGDPRLVFIVWAGLSIIALREEVAALKVRASTPPLDLMRFGGGS